MAAKNIQIDLQVLSALRVVASKEDTRYYLGGVHIEWTRKETIYVATDGHRLVAARHPAKNDCAGTLIVPIADCAALKVTKTMDGAGTLVIDDTSYQLRHGDNGHTFKPIDGTYPNWRRVFPSRVTVTPKYGHFNPHYLASFQKIADALYLPTITIHPQGRSAPALIGFAAHGPVEIVGALMPMRLSDNIHVPEWTRITKEQRKPLKKAA